MTNVRMINKTTKATEFTTVSSQSELDVLRKTHFIMRIYKLNK